MDAKKRLADKKFSRAAQSMAADIIQKSGGDWLQSRSERHGFALTPASIRVEGYQQHKTTKGKGKQPIQYSTLDIAGVLTVTDNDRFLSTLISGLGPAKAFGCGLLLVRPIQQCVY